MAIAPPFGLTRLSSNDTSSPRRQASTCEANASLISITSMLAIVRPARSNAFFAAGDAGRQDAADRLLPGLVAGLARGDDHRHRAVVDARGVAGGGDAIGKQRPQLGEGFHIGLRPRVLVLADRDRAGASTRHLDRDDLAGEEAVRLGGGVFCL